jgi:sugar phosphate isomerase/epimerase
MATHLGSQASGLRFQSKEIIMSTDHHVDRRKFLHAGAALAGLALVQNQPAAAQNAQDRRPTEFQIACMTLPYSQFPLDRALNGIKNAGYRYVAWGTTHREADGKPVPVIGAEAPPERARELARRCRDLGLEPLMMFSMIYPENPKGFEVLRQRLLQAAAAGIPQVLTFGHTKGGNRQVWVDRFKQLAPICRDSNVTLVVKQHGGETGTGEACAEITREVNHPNIKVNFDAGNVMDYLREKVDPIADLRKCADEVRSFCIKDHRNFPRGADRGQDCGPGFGEIDHWRLLQPVAFTGRPMLLCCENIFAPFVARPKEPEGVDALARRAREFLEIVIQGVQS